MEELNAFLCTFRCSRNTDLEAFLHGRAIPNEKRDLARTYLAVSPDSRILGYFSLNMRCGIVPEGSVSGSLYRRLNVQADTGVAQMYLVAQLGRSDDSSRGFSRRKRCVHRCIAQSEIKRPLEVLLHNDGGGAFPGILVAGTGQ